MMYKLLSFFSYCVIVTNGLSFFPNSKTSFTSNVELVNSINKMENNQQKSELNIEKDNTHPLTIKYYGTVTTESCLALTAMLNTLDTKSKEIELKYHCKLPIRLHMQSMGGELMPTFYVCDTIKNLETPVHVYIDGYVASAASAIAVCGDKRYMTKHSCMLIHQLKSTSSGKFTELKDELSNLNLFMGNLKDIYLENTRLNKTELEKLLVSDIWLPSEKCIEYGIIHEILQFKLDQ